MTTSRSSIPTLNLNRMLNAVVLMANREYEDEWKTFCSIEKTDKPFVEDVMMVTLPPAVTKAEGAGIQYGDIKEAYTSRGIVTTTALGFAITEEAYEDDVHIKFGINSAKMLVRSAKHTKNVRGANMFNNGFDSSYAGGDGKELFATDHPLHGIGGTFANELTTPASLSYESIKSLSILAGGFTNEQGMPEPTRIQKLIVPVDLEHEAEIIRSSMLRPGTADNDINSIRSLGILPKGVFVNHFLTSSTAYFAVTDCEHGLKHVVRKPIVTSMDGDFDTGNVKYKFRERYVFYWHNPRCALASSGA